MTTVTVADLPTENLLHALHYLSPTDRVRCMRTCRTWKEAIEQDLLAWRTIETPRKHGKPTDDMIKLWEKRLKDTDHKITHFIVSHHFTHLMFDKYIHSDLPLDITSLTVNSPTTILPIIWNTFRLRVAHVSFDFSPRNMRIHGFDIEQAAPNVPVAVGMQQTFENFVGSGPQLLTIHFKKCIFEPSRDCPARFRLKELHLEDVRLLHHFSMPLPGHDAYQFASYPRLRTVVLKNSWLPQLFPSLHESTSLVSLTIENSLASILPARLELPSLPRLKHLTLRGPSAKSQIIHFKYSFPRLTSLHVENVQMKTVSLDSDSPWWETFKFSSKLEAVSLLNIGIIRQDEWEGFMRQTAVQKLTMRSLVLPIGRTLRAIQKQAQDAPTAHVEADEFGSIQCPITHRILTRSVEAVKVVANEFGNESQLLLEVKALWQG